MRLSTSLIYQNGLNGILNQESTLSRLQEQLASGKRILTPADDPLAASLAVNVSQTQSMNDTYGSNRKTALQSLGAEENTLASVTTTLQDLLKQVVQAGNGTMSDADRQSLATSLQGARDQLLGLANSTDGNGQYLFSGYAGFTAPYVEDPATGTVSYAGDAGQRMIQVDQTRQMASADVGTDIFGKAAAGTLTYIAEAAPGNTGTAVYSQVSYDVPEAGNAVGRDFQIDFAADPVSGELQYTVTVVPADPAMPPLTAAYESGATIEMYGVSVVISGEPAAGDSFAVATPNDDNMDMFATLDSLIDTLKQPSTDDPVAQAALVNELASANKKLTLGLDNVLTVRASVGARMNELEALDATGTQKGLSYTKQLSDLEDVNVYEVTSQLILRQVALEAASLSFTRITGTSLFSRG